MNNDTFRERNRLLDELLEKEGAIEERATLLMIGSIIAS